MKNPFLNCCKRNNNTKGTMEKLDAQIEQNRLTADKKQHKTPRNIQILRDDLYQGIMKPFFAAG